MRGVIDQSPPHASCARLTTHTRMTPRKKKPKRGGGIDGWAWAHPPSSRLGAGRRYGCGCGMSTDGSHHHILYRYNPLYHGIPHAHMRTRTTHARTHAHARPRDGAFDGHRTRAMDTKNIKQKTKKRAFWRCTRGDEGPWSTDRRAVDPRATVSDHGDRGARRRRQSSTLLSSSSSSFEPHAHAMSTSAMMQAVGETMHAYTHDDHAMRRVVVVVVVVARAGREDATERCRRAYPSTSARTMAARADPGAKAARTSRGRTA